MTDDPRGWEKRREMPGTAEATSGMSRRGFLTAATAAVAAITAGCVPGREEIEAFFQAHFHEMSKADLERHIARLEEKYSALYGKDVSISTVGPIPETLLAYALDISRCVGCRRCVYGCVEENNQSRDPQIHWITVLQMEKEHGVDLHHATPDYNPETVPEPGKFYVPVQCQQCENPPCVKACPVEATWKERDGIVAIDYDWCIGCRCCVTACPYGARRFNWKRPGLPAAEVNPAMHYLGNRPRPNGVVEKCTFCIQRSRAGRYPRCVDACPVGARKFGNQLDPSGEIRYILENKRVFILKKELNTSPKFYYYYG
jgi:molybdopterin-containing oxidoreductase family iron-sulfur binding subunit